MAWRGGPGKAQFLALGYLDDELFLRYDEDSQKAQPWSLRHKGQAGAETWEQETEHLQEKEQQLRKTLAETADQKGQEGGLNTLQATLGCELGNLSTGGFWRLGYNGQDFFTFDPASLTWNATLPSARQSKKFWEVHGPSTYQVKNFLNEICPNQLRRYRASLRDVPVNTGSYHGQEGPLVELDGTLHRELSCYFDWLSCRGFCSLLVTVTHSKITVGRVTLKCSAFNVNPWGTTLTWLRGGDPVHQGIFGPGIILPNGNGTYQTWVATRVLPGEEQRFTCHLGHQGKNTMLPVVFGHPARRTAGAAAAASSLTVLTLCAVLVLVTSP
ncbi:LOW QUALITY PROTEIN: MHC class I-like protein MILL2 [Erethizon dorsatum]